MQYYKIFMLIILLLVITSISFINVDGKDLSLLGKVIYIDPGHGGADPGALYKDIRESDINLSISKVLASELEKQGAIVYLTRDGDYDLSLNNVASRKRSDLSRRSKLINDSMCDLYLSIHLNSDPSSTWHGAQVFYDDVNEKNELIASILQEQLKRDLKTDREIKEIKDIYLNRNVKRPGVLLEVGFISNNNERYLLRQEDYQLKLSKSIIKGIINYFNQ